MQYFKGDELEVKMDNAVKVILDSLSLQKTLFYEGAYEAFPLGEVLFDNALSPLSNAIKRDIFISSFKEVFDAFVVAGTFESYLTVFAKIFGDDVEVIFTIPAAGKLNIEINAAGVELSPFVSRYIEDNAYLFDYQVDYAGDNIVFQTIKGFQTQYELEQMLHEMVPAGIFTAITLTLGA